MYLLEHDFPQKDKHNGILKLGKSYSHDLQRHQELNYNHNISASTAANSVQKKYYRGWEQQKNPQQKNPGHVHSHKAVMVGDSSATEQEDILSRLILIHCD